MGEQVNMEHTVACQRLVAAIITMAVEDYRMFKVKGWIADGKVVKPPHWHCARVRPMDRSRGIYNRRNGAAELLLFFKPGGVMDEWIALARLEVNPSQIRRKLGLEALVA